MTASTVPPRTLIAVGVAALLLWMVWHLVTEWLVRRRLRARLAHHDPVERIAAVYDAADTDLASTARLLLRLAQTERDPVVLAGLVEAVARRQWEPASSAHIVALRLWTRRYVDVHQELRSVGLGPLAEGADSGRGGRRSDATDDDVKAVQTGPFDDGLPSLRVLVTGAGGPAGVAVIRRLLAGGHEVVAVDSDPLAVGLHLAGGGHVIPLASHPRYLDSLLEVIEVARPVALVCTVAEEYRALCPAAGLLRDRGVATLMPTLEAVESCSDKWRFAQVMAAAGLPAPRTVLGEANGLAGPWVVKPRFGRGSVGVHLVDDRSSLDTAVAVVADPIVQARLSGREFTVDALITADGSLAGAVARWRLETKAGISTKGLTFEHPELHQLVWKVLSAVRLVGPSNVQGFVAPDGSLSVIEVNPRFSGGLPLSLHAGADFVGEYLRAMMGLPIRPERLVGRPGVTMMRHYAEVFEG